jgi:Tfp pilus assembly protein PilN
MNNSDNKLVYLLWGVIAVLIIGSTAGGFFLIRHASVTDQANANLMGDNDSLKRQIQQLKATPAPTSEPAPIATPAATPVSSKTPVPSSNP